MGHLESFFYHKLGLESMSDRCRFQELVFYKIVNGLSPQYLVRYLNLNDSSTFLTRASKQNKIKGISVRAELLVLPSCIN